MTIAALKLRRTGLRLVASALLAVLAGGVAVASPTAEAGVVAAASSEPMPV